MSIIRNLLLTLGAMSALCASADKHYVGGDISLLPEYEKAGAIYKTHDGKKIDSLLPWLREQGMNAMRVRLFVDPKAYTGNDKDPNACQDLEYITPLCKQIVDNGFDLMLDFHYSDFWADPAKQWTPKAWENLTDKELYEKIYDYTRSTLLTLKEQGIVPAFIQPGNEISYGMLWGKHDAKPEDLKKCYSGSQANWQRFATLLRQAIKACREVCPDVKIILHTERVNKPDIQQNFYRQMRSWGVDYDIIGLSYYTYFHGNMSVLDNALNQLESEFPDKNIMIVETGYAYKWEVPGTDQKVDYDYSDAGQNQFAKDLVALLERHKSVDGLFWWWMEYNAYGTKLANWYNAPLFDSTDGRACSALTTICTFATDGSSVSPLLSDSQNVEIWYDLQGRPVISPLLSGIYVSSEGRKIIRH